MEDPSWLDYHNISLGPPFLESVKDKRGKFHFLLPISESKGKNGTIFQLGIDVSSLELNAPHLILSKVSRTPTPYLIHISKRRGNRHPKNQNKTKKQKKPGVYSKANSSDFSLTLNCTILKRDSSKNGSLRNWSQWKRALRIVFSLPPSPFSTVNRLFLFSICGHGACANPLVKISFSEMCHIVDSKPPVQ